jgi:hypothetical protein
MTEQSRSLREVLVDVVCPAIDTLLPTDDITYVSLTRSLGETHRPAGIELRIRVGDDEFRDWVFQDDSMGDWGSAEVRDRLLSNLQDFVSESSFAWGELREF